MAIDNCNSTLRNLKNLKHDLRAQLIFYNCAINACFDQGIIAYR